MGGSSHRACTATSATLTTRLNQTNTPAWPKTARTNPKQRHSGSDDSGTQTRTSRQWTACCPPELGILEVLTRSQLTKVSVLGMDIQRPSRSHTTHPRSHTHH